MAVWRWLRRDARLPVAVILLVAGAVLLPLWLAWREPSQVRLYQFDLPAQVQRPEDWKLTGTRCNDSDHVILIDMTLQIVALDSGRLWLLPQSSGKGIFPPGCVTIPLVLPGVPVLDPGRYRLVVLGVVQGRWKTHRVETQSQPVLVVP